MLLRLVLAVHEQRVLSQPPVLECAVEQRGVEVLEDMVAPRGLRRQHREFPDANFE